MSNEISINQEQANFLVYKHTNKINGKVYIGITSQKPEKRWGHNGCNYKKNPHFWSAIQQYGWGNFDHEIIQENMAELDAKLLEEKLIMEYNSTNSEMGYNHELSSVKSHIIHSEDTRNKISEGNKGKKRTDDQKHYLSELWKKKYSDGLVHPLKDRHFEMSKETKEKISKSNMGKNKGKVHSKEWVEKCASKLRGKSLSDEHKKKISESNTGRIITDEGRRNISIAASKRTYSEPARKSFAKCHISKHAFNNGVITVYRNECPDGFTPGRITDYLTDDLRESLRNSRLGKKASEDTKKLMSESLKKVIHTPEWNKKVGESNRGKHWYTDGISNAYCFETEVPDGFHKGMTRKNKISSNNN